MTQPLRHGRALGRIFRGQSVASGDTSSKIPSRGTHRALFAVVFFFSIFVNLLMLTGPVFMLQVYDRVLSSRSEATLVALVAIVALLYAVMGLLDHARGRISARIGARIQHGLDRQVHEATLQRLAIDPADPLAHAGQRDLEAVQRLLSSPGFLALFDMPWAPVFILAIAMFHPVLGWLALVGGGVLIALAGLNQLLTRARMAEAASAATEAEAHARQLRAEAELVQSLGMRGSSFRHWQQARSRALQAMVSASDRGGGFSATAKAYRLFLQSAILAAGAWLVLQDQLTAGAMIAASILLGRALAPVDASIGQWPVLQATLQSWQRLGQLLAGRTPETAPRTALPRPRAVLAAEGLTITPPGASHVALRSVSFRLEPGQALGVIGPTGAGKSTLARALVGAWQPAGGKVRLDGAALGQYDPDALGRLIGYLPQRVALFAGTIAENIARLDSAPVPEQIVSAARKAGAHDMILALPEGYDTRLGPLGWRLSGGQAQRIGLARALYGDPVLAVLDEPDSSLDNDGVVALNRAIRLLRAEGAAVVVMAHRPAALQDCDLLMMLSDGRRAAFGPREEVLRDVLHVPGGNLHGAAAKAAR